MQPNLQTEFQLINNQQGNTGIGPKGNSSKENIGIISENECFIGMLNRIERISEKNTINLAKLHEMSQTEDNMLGMAVKIEQETASLTNDLTLTEQRPAELLLGSDKNETGNEENIRLWGYCGNTNHENSSVEKNNMVVAAKTESNSGTKNSALSEMINISVKVEENEAKAGQGELEKNSAEVQILKRSEESAGKESAAQISKGVEGTVGKETGAQLLKDLGADIAKTIKNSNTKSPNMGKDIKHTADKGDAEKTAVSDRIVIEGKTVHTGVEEAKIVHRQDHFNDELKSSEASKKDLVLKIVSAAKEEEQEADSFQRDNTSGEKSSPQDKEFIRLKEIGLKIKASVTESSAGKMIHLESESKDSGIIPSENISGDKSLEEMTPGRENRLASTISRTGTLKQIVQKAALNLKNGKSQVRIDLKPEFLGSVRMKIATENQMVTVRILTELPVVKEMIESNLGQLKSDLQSHGMEIDRLDVSVASDSQQHRKGFEKADFLSEKENSDNENHHTVLADETGTASLLKESTAVNGLDFFA
ncbi:MAG: flagellar hook-length control protein FliK [Thermodesulfobacteriota bacterium]|nr:flagellar hook-length control protein FliK [Thermodesulfobacteriota bacterium]